MIRFVLIVLISTAFHQTAIVFLPVYFLCGMKFSKSNVFIISVLSITALLIAGWITSIANSMFDRTYTSTFGSGGYVAAAIYVIAILTTLFFDDSLKRNNKQTPLLYVLIIGFTAYILRYVGSGIAERLSFYFVFAQLALLPNAKKIVVGKDRLLVRLGIVVLAVALMIYRLYGSGFTPYKFFWQ